MKRFKRYEWYKDSGVEWIGKIPLHWEQVRMKFLCKVNPSKSDLKVPRNTKVTFLPMENIGEDGTLNLNEERELTDVWDGFTYFKDDDVIIAKITPCFENGKGALCRNLINGLGFGTTELHVLRAKNQVVPGFIWYVTKSHGFRVMGEAMMQGAAGQKRVPKDFIENFVVCVPTPVEQQAIVNFLDRKTAEIDSLIADKERLIELLQEQRQAIITQAVTKGLDPNVPMKDSGVEWIGEIPEHWLTVAVKRVYDIKLGKMLQPTQNKSDDVLVPYLKALHVQWEKIEVNEYPEMWASPKDIEMFSVKPGDLLICEGGEVGRAAILEDLDRPCIIQNSLHRIRPSVKAKNKYLLYILQIISQKGWLDVLCNKATIAHFTSDKLGNLRIPLPPIEEQEKVIKVIENKAKLLNNYISCEREIIEKLKNYRQSLITAAVTGKIDVRDYYNLRSE